MIFRSSTDKVLDHYGLRTETSEVQGPTCIHMSVSWPVIKIDFMAAGSRKSPSFGFKQQNGGS